MGSTATARVDAGRAASASAPAPNAAAESSANASNAYGRDSGLYVRPSELTAKREAPGRLAGEMHSSTLDESQRAETGATKTHPQERGAEGEKTPPVTATSVPPDDGPDAGDRKRASGAGAPSVRAVTPERTAHASLPSLEAGATSGAYVNVAFPGSNTERSAPTPKERAYVPSAWPGLLQTTEP